MASHGRLPSSACMPDGQPPVISARAAEAGGSSPRISRPMARSCGRWIQTLSTSRCGEPQLSRRQWTPSVSPSSPLRAMSRSASIPWWWRHLSMTNRRSPASRARRSAAAGSAVIGFSTYTGTPSSEHLVEDAGVRRGGRGHDDALDLTERLHLLDDAGRRLPTSARPTLSAERATTGTRQPSSCRSRRILLPQRPQPTSPMTAVSLAPGGLTRRIVFGLAGTIHGAGL